jgi:alpha-glucoside transport system substrate-binding protein
VISHRPRWRTCVAGLLAALLLVTSCTGGRSAPGAARLGTARLEVIASWTGTEQVRFEAVLRDFTRRTGVSVTYTSGHGRLVALLDARLMAAQPPDVALLPQPGLLRRYAAAGELVPLDRTTVRLVERHYASVWRSLGSADSHMYGVWFKAANKSLIWYDVGAFERAGVVPPDHLDGLLPAVRSLRAHAIVPFSLAAADPWTLTDWFENLYLRIAGPTAYDRLAAHRIPWTDPTVDKTLALMSQLLSPKFVLGGIAGAQRTGFEGSVTAAFARPAHAAMVSEGDFVASVITARTSVRIGVDVDVIPFPEVQTGAPTVMGGGDVAVQMRSSAAGTELMRYLATPEAAAIWAAVGGFISPNLDLDLSDYPDAYARSVARSLLESGDSFRFDLSDLQPAAFGAEPTSGMQRDLRLFLATPNVSATARRLEADASAAYTGQPR